MLAFPWRSGVLVPSAGTFFSEALIDLLSKHLIGVTDLTLSFDYPWKSFVIQRHIGKIAVGYEDAIRLVSPDHPSLDVHGDRRLSNADQIGINAHDIAAEHRRAERHGVHGNRCSPSPREGGREDSSRDVHLSEQPPPENISV